MPAQDRARRDQPMPSQHLRQPPNQRSQDRSIRPVQTGLRIGSAQHGDFMSQHQKLDVLGRRRAAEQLQQVQKLHEDQVEQTHRHGSIMLCRPGAPTPRSAVQANFWNPTRSKPRYRSSWAASASNSVRITRHGPLNPNAAVNNPSSSIPLCPCYATITDSHAANETITPSSTHHAGTTLTG
jgi:hypothetical protein